MDPPRVVDGCPLLVDAACDPVGLVHDRQVERRYRVLGVLGLFDLVQGVVGTDHRQRRDLVLPLPHNRHQRGQRVRVGGRHHARGHQIVLASHVHRGDDHRVLQVPVAAPCQCRLRREIQGGHHEQHQPYAECVRHPGGHQRLAGPGRRHIQRSRSHTPQMPHQSLNGLDLVGKQRALLGPAG